jgi:DNA mismatch repair ATPase MutL
LLQQSQFQKQALIRPKTLHLSAEKELFIEQRMAEFHSFGWDIEYHEKDKVSERVILKGVPVCRNMTLTWNGNICHGLFWRPRRLDH